MNFSLSEILMTLFILVCMFMGAHFLVLRKQGKTFVASFDKAIAWGGGLFVVGGVLGTIIH